MRISASVLAILIIAAIAYSLVPSGSSDASAEEGAPIVKIEIPGQLSEIAMLGKQAFDIKCASCHAENAVGHNGVAPPLVHKIYEPNHHGDESFQRAVAMGVRAHHWKFENMPAIEWMTRADMKVMIA
ncbi:MAG: cytochrome c [Paracoccaceae bacterium]